MAEGVEQWEPVLCSFLNKLFNSTACKPGQIYSIIVSPWSRSGCVIAQYLGTGHSEENMAALYQIFCKALKTKLKVEAN